MTVSWSESYFGQLRALAGDRTLLLTAARLVLRHPEDGLLLIRRADNGVWSFPAGTMELGESIADCAVRELREETGLVVPQEALRPVGYERISVQPGTEVAPWDAGDNHIAVYGTWLTARMPVAPAADDVAEAGWFRHEEAVELCGDQHWWVLVERWFRAGPR